MNTRRSLGILVTGARAPVALELARMFAQAGHRVYAADSIRFHGCAFSRMVKHSYCISPPRQQRERFVQDLIQIVQKEQIDWIIPTCEEIFYVAEALPELSCHCQVLTESLDVLLSLHDKGRFIQLLASLGITVPHTVVCRSPEEVTCALQEWGASSGAKVVLKPVYSRFAARVKIVGERHHPLAAHEVTAQTPWLAQQYIEGTEYCTYSLAKAGNVLAHTTYTGAFRAGAGASIAFAPCRHHKIERWVSELVKRLRFSGQIAFDLIETEQGEIFPLECNPRATSGIHLLAMEPGFVDAFFQESLEEMGLFRKEAIYPGAQTAMLAAAMLLYGFPEAVSQGRVREWLKVYRQARDVLYQADDPFPVAAQPLTMAALLARSVRYRESLLAASTRDIEWNGEER